VSYLLNLLLGVVGAYAVRLIDYFFRRKKKKEKAPSTKS